MYIVGNMLNTNYWELFNGSLFNLGLNKNEFIVAIASLFILVSYELYERTNNVFKDLSTFNIGIRWSFYLVAIFSIIIFGVYGDYEKSQFIYFQF
jgi:hypothetical protein